MEGKVLKTGTTTVGIVCKDGVILAADKKVTSGYLIASTKMEKVLIINEDIALTTAGTVSDIQLFVKLLKAQIKLDELKKNQKLKTGEVVNFLASVMYSSARQYIPAITGFLMAGRDVHGTHLYELNADGAILQHEEFVCDGSGMPYATGVLEAGWKKDMSVEEGIKLVVKAISASIQRDIGSGGGIDIVTVTKDGIKKVYSKQLDTKLVM